MRRSIAACVLGAVLVWPAGCQVYQLPSVEEFRAQPMPRQIDLMAEIHRNTGNFDYSRYHEVLAQYGRDLVAPVLDRLRGFDFSTGDPKEKMARYWSLVPVLSILVAYSRSAPSDKQLRVSDVAAAYEVIEEGVIAYLRRTTTIDAYVVNCNNEFYYLSFRDFWPMSFQARVASMELKYKRMGLEVTVPPEYR